MKSRVFGSPEVIVDHTSPRCYAMELNWNHVVSKQPIYPTTTPAPILYTILQKILSGLFLSSSVSFVLLFSDSPLFYLSISSVVSQFFTISHTLLFLDLSPFLAPHLYLNSFSLLFFLLLSILSHIYVYIADTWLSYTSLTHKSNHFWTWQCLN